eukprot:TRINITY_DN3160_c0_g1_i12.p1 TRINITY_DN3160_c0_g1~~TRINITY_DN3160_c0_g1_i12.p1  ORF type:complete len:288 (+),score=37.85 TRINITY_DN3160_c0_g1_i12:35-898(+)
MTNTCENEKGDLENSQDQNLTVHLDKLKLTENDLKSLEKQNSRIVNDFKANKLEAEAKKNWDLFYKRNETKFFKDRHWTTREFEELIGSGPSDTSERKTLLEVGCGVGNFVFPLLEENLNLYIYCCDFSPRGVDFVKKNELYDESRVKAFVCDITTDGLTEELGDNSVDIISMVFVLSAIHPDKHHQVFKNLWRVLKPGGILLFRDYAMYDMTMIRFGPGSKIAERFYTRQDGTRTFFFTPADLDSLGKDFTITENQVVQRRTVNKKEGVDATRLFLQAKFIKEASS